MTKKKDFGPFLGEGFKVTAEDPLGLGWYWQQSSQPERLYKEWGLGENCQVYFQASSRRVTTQGSTVGGPWVSFPLREVDWSLTEMTRAVLKKHLSARGCWKGWKGETDLQSQYEVRIEGRVGRKAEAKALLLKAQSLDQQDLHHNIYFNEIIPEISQYSWNFGSPGLMLRDWGGKGRFEKHMKVTISRPWYLDIFRDGDGSNMTPRIQIWEIKEDK